MKRIIALLLTIVIAQNALAADAKRLVIDGGVPWCVEDLTPAAQNFSMNSSDDHIGWSYQMPEADTITQVCFRYGARTGTPPTYKVSLMGQAAASCDSDGTILGGGSPAEKTFTPPADATWDGTWRCETLANSIALTRGQVVHPDIRYSSGTVDGSNFSSFTSHWHNCRPNRHLPITSTVSNGGTATCEQGIDFPVFALKSATKTYGYPILSTTRTQYSSDSTPDEFGMAFTFDASWFSSGKLIGAEFNIRTPAAGKTFLAKLYQGTTLLQDVTVRGDWLGGVNQNGATITVYFDEVTLSTLTAGTEYIVSLVPQETSSNLALYTYDANAAAELSAWGGGTAFYLVTRSDGGAWTTTTTKRPAVRLIMDDITAPVSATTGRGPQISAPYVITQSEATAAQKRIYFNLVDATDGNAAETGVTVAAAECQISENGGAFANCGGTVTEVGGGYYYYELHANDIDTVGCHLLKIEDAAAQKTAVPYCLRQTEEIEFAPTGLMQESTTTSWVLASTETSTDIGGQAILHVPSGQVRRCNTYNTGTKACAVDAGADPAAGDGYVKLGLYGTLGTGVTATADVTKWNGTTVANPNTAGYPVVHVTSGTGTGEISLSSGLVSVAAVGTGAITAASFGAGAIDATAIAADAIGASEIATDAIGAAEIASAAIAADEIAADAIGAAEIASAAIAADEIATDAIGAAEIASAAIAADEIATDAIGAAEIAANAITATEVADATIDAATFAAGAIDAGAIATDAITATEIAANAIGDAEVGATLTVDIIGSLSGSVASVTGEVGSVAAGGIAAASFAAGAIDATAVAADAIGASELAADAIGASEVAANAINDAELADALTVSITGNVTGNLSGSVGSVGAGGIAAATFAAGAIDAAAVAADAIGASELAASAIGTSEFAAESEVNAEVVDALATDTYTELTACPANGTASITSILRYLYMVARNKVTSDDSTTSVFKDDGATVLCEQGTSVAAGTFTRTEQAAP